MEVTLTVQHSLELESELLALGEDVQVIAPAPLRQRMQRIAEASVAAYDQPVTPAEFACVAERFRKTGFVQLRRLLTLRETKRLKLAVRHLQRQESLFTEAVGKQQLEITRLLPERVLTALLQAAARTYAQLGLTQDRPQQIFLNRVDPEAESAFVPYSQQKLVVCLTRWRKGARGLECLIGQQSIGFDAGYGQAVLLRAGMAVRMRGQLRQVFWWLEVI